MVQIERRKKKGRPSKADLAARQADSAAEIDAGVSPSSAEVRRSLRRRSFRYNIIDYDEDYLDDDVSDDDDEVVVGEDDDVEDEDDDDDEEEAVKYVNGERRKRRGKKVKLVVKINNNNNSSSNNNSNAKRSSSNNGRVVNRRGRATSGESEDEDEDEDEREVKKRRINVRRNDEDDEEDEDDEGKNRKEEPRGGDYVSEIPNGGHKNNNYNGDKNNNHDGDTPLPDKKQLELILDKLQKKDTYGVYSEPVDPDELPDYHDIIENPMDFSTVRKKLADSSYSTLEQFESDVFLISANAMEYNAAETVYHKQARAIKELGEKKFQRIRMQIERLQKEPKSEPKCEPKFEPKSEHKERFYPPVKKQIKKQFHRGTQEPLGSDFSSGASLATLDALNTCGTDHAGPFDRPRNIDGPVDSVSFLPDNNLEKAEDAHSGKGILPKFGRRSFVVDENRRATYNISIQPDDRSESIFTTFDGNKKQLIPVGLSGDYSYARSLARFAANLGPRAWGIASKRIEQVIPPGLKHGRGWIGDYEPLPAAVFVVEHQKDPFASKLNNFVGFKKDDSKNPVVSRSLDPINCRKDDKLLEDQVPATVHHRLNQPSSDGKLVTVFGSGSAKPHASNVSVLQQHNPFSKGSEHIMVKESEANCPYTNSQPNNPAFQPHSRFARDSFCPENMGAKRVEPNSPSISDQKIDTTQKQLPHGMGLGKQRVEINSLPTSHQKADHVAQKQPHHLEMPKQILHGIEIGKKRVETNTQPTSHQKTDTVLQKQPHCFEMPKQLPHGMEIGKKRVETNSQPNSHQKTDNAPQKQPHCLEMPASMFTESLTRNKNFLQSLPFKQPDTNGSAPDRLSNGVNNNFVANNQVNTSSPRLMSPQLSGAAVSFSQRQDQGLSDPVLVMKMLTEKAQKQQNGATRACSPAQARPSAPSPRGDTGGNAAVAAASAWMSVGSAGYKPDAQNSATTKNQTSADSLCNTTRMFYPHAMQSHAEYPVSATTHIPPEKTSLPFKSFPPQPTKIVEEAQVPSRPMVFPPNDFSRFQVQAPWRGLSPHIQQKQKQDMLPPDLNVAFQSSVDSQQPDLALQL